MLGRSHDGMGWCVTLARGNQGGNTLRTAWLIDATGRRAAVARRAGAARRRDDALVAFYARFRTRASTDLDGRTAVESVPDGWWYTARVPSGERVVAFLTDADLVDRAAVLSAAGFAARLDATRYIRGLLVAHRYEPVGPPRAAGAQTARLDRFGGPAWTAVGDAAISFDPLSSQGILTALFTGFRAGMAVDPPSQATRPRSTNTVAWWVKSTSPTVVTAKPVTQPNGGGRIAPSGDDGWGSWLQPRVEPDTKLRQRRQHSRVVSLSKQEHDAGIRPCLHQATGFSDRSRVWCV